MEQVRIGTDLVSVDHMYGHTFRWSIDFADGTEHSGDDLRCGAMGADECEMLGTLLSFLEAAGESYGYTVRTGRVSDNSDLFPPSIMEWAYVNSDEISMARYAIEEV